VTTSNERSNGRRRAPRVPALMTPWRAAAPATSRLRTFVGQLCMLTLTAALAAIVATSAYGASVVSASFSGGAGTASVGGTLYAKQGATLTLTVTTDSNTKCVRVTDGTTSIDKDAASAQTSWTFTSADSTALFVAGSGSGVKTVTATAFKNANGQHKCTANAGEDLGVKTASYILDNTGPAVSGTLSPAANGAGWNKNNVTINWSATDGASGVASGPTPATDSVTSETAGITKSSSASDAVGNPGNGSVTVKLDKTAPSINASRSPAANVDGWNNSNVTVSFTCSDALSGIKSCTGGGSVIVSTEGANQSVPGTAVDNADNVNNAGVIGISIDKTAPLLSGAPTTSANGAGWYNNNVTVHWTCSDALSGIAGSCPADSTISGEGTGLTASASVNDVAGNSTAATNSPAVKIDKTAPVTSVTAPSGWTNGAQTLNFSATDGLSGVNATWFSVDGALAQQGTTTSVAGDGEHTVEYWSVDNAGNAETHHSVTVKIDGTPPTITPSQSPAANANGWNNTNVDVSFACADTVSGIASCTPTQTITAEGANQDVTGTAIDNAANSATAHESVSIDKTAPSIVAAPDRAANAGGWYDDDVVVSFTCGDSLSGIDVCATPKTLGEGANQSASGTASDLAGNSASASVTGINVDKTAPTLSGAATTSPNANGWYSGDVTVSWTCSDALSGIAGSCPDDSTVSGEGDDLVASASVSDKAGNSKSANVGPIKIDRTAPITSASAPAPLESGWYAGPVQVTLGALDSVSGVDATYYSIDGGTTQTYGAPFTVTGGGSHTVSYWSTDKAGNIEDKTADGHSITLKIDNLPPTIVGDRTPAANSFGWNNTPVTVSFSCSDAESGVSGCSDPTMLTTEGAGQSATGNAADNAGNTAEATVKDINIDLTSPTLDATLPDANADGWYNGDVPVHWVAQDGLSGVDPATVPADATITGEGSNLGAGPASVSDKAGNTTSQSATGVHIDRHGPSISGTVKGAAGATKNAAGWWNGGVAVDFSCSDPQLADSSAGSGVASCPSSKTLSGDGANQSVTSDVAKDVAGNTTAGITVSGINIDGHAPQTTADNQCTKSNGWCTGASATVVLTSTDIGPSGVKRIYYSVNGGTAQSTTSNPASVSVPLDGAGHATVDYYGVDNADNTELSNRVTLDYDNIAPTVTHSLTPAANAAGWNKDNTTVHFNATDTDSGVDITSITPDVFVSAETGGLTVNGSAKDVAGNLGTDSVLVKLDKTAPTITGSITSGTLGNNGWYTGPVTVGFSCSDALSGLALTACPDSVTSSSNGANQSVTRSVSDIAGNSSSATVGPFKIDGEAPAITSVTPANGSQYVLGTVPAATCAANDSFSGVASCTVTVTGGTPNGVGTFNYTATATDKAGNTTTDTGSYRVIYNVPNGVPFFLQPINDTAHTVSTTLSVFKAGQTVPVKFQLKNAAGQIVQANAVPIWQTPSQGNATTSPVNESLFSTTGDSGGTFRWDSSGQQYIYNWNTSSGQGGYYWKIGVKLDDGMTYYTDIGLRK
jgi:hypothetical protein